MDGGEIHQIRLSEQPFDSVFHPTSSVIAAGLITGNIEVFEYSETAVRPLHAFTAHTDSCRGVCFSSDGMMLLSASADKSILSTDANSGQAIARLENAHSDGINALRMISPSVIATGDDSGGIKVWDVRQQICCAHYEGQHEDFIADFEYSETNNVLLAVSGDGTMSAMDLRNTSQILGQSENQEDELLSVVLMKGESKVVCGSQGGILNIFSYGTWDDISDRFPGHPQSVDTLVKIDDETLFSGSSDGMIRVVSVLPNKLLGVVGEHMDCPIERLALSPDSRLLSSVSHDNTIKLWDVGYITHEEEESPAQSEGAANMTIPAFEQGEEAMEDSDEESKGKKEKKKKKDKGNIAPKNNFFQDLL